MNWLSKTRQKRCWMRLNSGELLLMICLLSRMQGCYSFNRTIIHTIFSCIALFVRHVELTPHEDKIFEDYQVIYEKILEMEQERVMERKDGGRERVR